MRKQQRQSGRTTTTTVEIYKNLSLYRSKIDVFESMARPQYGFGLRLLADQIVDDAGTTIIQGCLLRTALKC